MKSHLSFAFSIVGLLLFLTTPNSIKANTGSTPASRMAGDVLYAMRHIQDRGGNIDSVKLEDLRAYLNFEILDRESQGNFASSIELLGATGPVRNSSRMLVITAHQIWEDRKGQIGRYAVWKCNDKLTMNWEKEGDVAVLFTQINKHPPNQGLWKQPNMQTLTHGFLRACGFAFVLLAASGILWLFLRSAST